MGVKNNFSEDIRKFLIEHELGRQIAKMLAQSLISWDGGSNSRERVARFLNAYSLFITIHTDKENIFFDVIEERGSLSEEEHSLLLRHYKTCQMMLEEKLEWNRRQSL